MTVAPPYSPTNLCLCANQEPRRIRVGALSLLVCKRCERLILRERNVKR